MRVLRFFLLMSAGLFLFAPYALHAQKNLTKIVVDARTKLPVDYVFVRSDDDNIKLMTGKDGKFIFINNHTAKNFVFYKMGYRQHTLKTETLLSADTIF